MSVLNLSKKGKIAALSAELERPVMEVLWAKGPMTGRDLYFEVRREKTIAYTTALTVLDRLSKKGFVRKDRHSGRIAFSARISRDEYLGLVTDSLVEKAFETSPDLAVSAFADLFSKMPDKEIVRLERLIQEKKNGRHA